MPRADCQALWHLAETFGRLADACRSEAELHRLLADVIRELGYDWFALVFGVGHGCPLKDWLWIFNYPDEWAEIFFARGYYLRDPVLCSAERTSELFPWRGLESLRPRSELDLRIMNMAKKYGLIHGFTYPCNRVREPSGSLSFVSRNPRIMTVSERQCIVAIGSFALAAARRLRGYPDAALARPKLEPYLLGCVELVAMGMKDHEIAREQNISVESARIYVKRAREALNVSNRSQLGVEALRLGLIGFSDVKPPRLRD